MNLVLSHIDELIDPNSDLSALAAEMVDSYLAAAKEETDGNAISELIDGFEDQIREMLIDHDVLPALGDMQARLLDRLGS